VSIKTRGRWPRGVSVALLGAVIVRYQDAWFGNILGKPHRGLSGLFRSVLTWGISWVFVIGAWACDDWY
jgi:hypothetical protein